MDNFWHVSFLWNMKAWQLSPWANWAVENDVGPLPFYCLCLVQIGTTTSLQPGLESHLSQTYTDLRLCSFFNIKETSNEMNVILSLDHAEADATTLIRQCLPQIDSNHVMVRPDLAACFINLPRHIPCVFDFFCPCFSSNNPGWATCGGSL